MRQQKKAKEKSKNVNAFLGFSRWGVVDYAYVS
jgi:hypothetical protein